jgi:putative molybdopterin biosynthesis protein
MAVSDRPNTDEHGAWMATIRRAARQEQFLDVVSPAEAERRFHQHIDLSPLPAEQIALAAGLGRVLASDIVARVDVPAFDRSGVDGFAVRAADVAGASDSAPRRLRLNHEVIACGHAPSVAVQPGTATTIATGGMIPRGADAVVMIEQTEFAGEAVTPAIDVRRSAAAGQFIAYAGSDIARGETLLRQGTRIGSREIGMLAACGVGEIDVVRRPKVAVLSTGDELVQPGKALPPGGVYDSNGAILLAAVAEVGGEPLAYGAFPDDEVMLEDAVRRALQECDFLVLSGGTSKGAGDLSHRVISRLPAPGVLVHGVALKPGKPLCLAVAGRKPIAVLPGFPTSAIFTFHRFVAPVIRAQAGLPPEAGEIVEAQVPVRIASELGREEFVLVALVQGHAGPLAFPSPKGSGSVTTFAQADGFLAIEALAVALDAGNSAKVTLIGSAARAPDLVIMGSHDVALDVVLGRLSKQGFTARTLAVGSLGGVAALRRGECDLAPVHLIDPETGSYNRHLVTPGSLLVAGWRRMQGVVFRRGDARFQTDKAATALQTALADPDCLMVSRNAGSGTRVLIDELLAGARPPGYANQPRSHNAVAAAVAQGRADWGVAIEPVARLYDLNFLPLAPERYDFLLLESRRERAAVQAFLTALRDPQTRARIAALGMQPSDE